MNQLAALAFVALPFSLGCAATSPSASRLPVRILSSESANAPRPEPAKTDGAGSSDSTPRDGATSTTDATAPRIGAPGGSGAGSRRVVPAQSGNETVGGLPAGGAGVGVGVAG